MADQRIKDMRLPLFALLLSERLATHGSVTASITVPIPRIIAMVSAAFAKNCGNVVFEFVGIKNVSRYVVIIPLMSPLAKSPRHRAKILPFVIFSSSTPPAVSGFSGILRSHSANASLYRYIIVAPFDAQANKQIIKNRAALRTAPKIFAYSEIYSPFIAGTSNSP